MQALIDGAPEEIEVMETPKDPELSDRLGEVEFLITGQGRSPLPALFPKMVSLKVIQTTSAGVDSVIPLVPDGVTLCSARGSYGIVAEWVVAAILADYKGFAEFRDAQLSGHWAPRPVRRLEGSTVLLLGYGSIGEGVEARLAPFGVEFMKVARTARPGVQTLEELPQLLPSADIVVLLVPLTPATEGLVDREFLAQMKLGSLLVNVARGRVVDTDALLEALKAERLSAVLDVTDPEPLPEHHPLFELRNVLITPHIAGGPLARAEVHAFLQSQLQRYARGEALQNVVLDGY
jgi:phosphoglycerate dehydrogenase-like enzyme